MDRSGIKDLAKAIVKITDPGDVFVIEDGFDDIADNWFKARGQDEGHFLGGIEIAGFVSLIVPFLLGIFADTAKGIITDQAKRAINYLLDRVLTKTATTEEAANLGTEMDDLIAKSRYSDEQKKTLKLGFKKLLASMGTAT